MWFIIVIIREAGCGLVSIALSKIKSYLTTNEMFLFKWNKFYSKCLKNGNGLTIRGSISWP